MHNLESRHQTKRRLTPLELKFQPVRNYQHNYSQLTFNENRALGVIFIRNKLL